MASFPTMNKSSSVPTQVVQPHSEEGAIGSVIALSFVIFLTITGNAAIIVIFRVFKRVRKQVTNHFLINLAISDLIVALVTMPFWLVWEIDRWRSVLQWIDKDTLDRIWTFVDIGKFY
ncbi:tyramine receptor 1-like [Paramuricea clavata]|uniref:Tyramine receptor 1-like n=1 Tax=Paramuricea clavata TaxID=317549 RepID=A0A6S7FRD3_PARCT|nr:tyramine receptor 1-like [Paramuricea clavata]